jgi:uncharacterized protein (DUF488 family)
LTTSKSSHERQGTCYTIGHSNYPLEQFIEILNAHGIERVIDVRRFPASRKWPHFNAGSLSETLPAAGIDYVSLPELGGRRSPRPDSPHFAWRTDAFRGYADYMDTPSFQAGLKRLIPLALEKRSTLMCAEVLPWRCHRSLIADTLIVRGWVILEIMSAQEARVRKLPPFARVEGTRVIYDVGVLF